MEEHAVLNKPIVVKEGTLAKHKVDILTRSYTEEERKVFSKMEIVILSPMMIIEPMWVKSVVNMMAFSWMQGLKVYQMGITIKTVVDWARNELAELGLNYKCDYTGRHFTHFLWLDTDHTFNADLACQLARSFVFPEVDAVGALYYMSKGPTLPVVYVKDDSPDKWKHYPIIDVPNSLCEVDAFGFGAVLMKRDVFERVPKPWFTIDWRGGEDVVFCTKAREHGVRLFLDGRYKLGHVGEAPIIGEQTHVDYMKEHEDEYSDRVKVALGGKKVDG